MAGVEGKRIANIRDVKEEVWREDASFSVLSCWTMSQD